MTFASEDAVLTPTAARHARRWNETFDPLPTAWGRSPGTYPDPFDADRDYVTHGDGRLRDDGVRDVLRARGSAAPDAGPDGPPKERSVDGIGGRPQALVERALRAAHVDAVATGRGLVIGTAPAEPRSAAAEIVVADLAEMLP